MVILALKRAEWNILQLFDKALVLEIRSNHSDKLWQKGYFFYALILIWYMHCIRTFTLQYILEDFTKLNKANMSHVRE